MEIEALVCAIKMLVGQMQAEALVHVREAALCSWQDAEWGTGVVPDAKSEEYLRLLGELRAAERQAAGLPRSITEEVR